ncbi:glycosyltransferase family 2 protein [Labilibacter sediminis]|nr:glycosyltransferase family 2 protein [Labilibacter sediminis]
MTNPLISILIPLCNAEHFLKETVLSALNQTWKNIEIIIVDDGSTDTSYAIAKGFESEKVKVYQQTNKGACAARNLAFKKSTGDYIQYLDADDLLAPDKIKQQMKLFEKYGNNIICSGQWGRFYQTINDVKWEEQAINKDYPSPINWLIDCWNGRGMAQTSVWLTPRHLIDLAEPWNESLSINQDGEYFSRVLMQASEIKYCDEAKIYYRSGNVNSISQRKKSDKKVESLLYSYELYQQNCSTYINDINVKKALGNNYLNFIYQHHLEFPQLAKKAESLFFQLDIGKMWPVGGHRFKKLASIIGFKNAIRINSLINV